MEAVKRALLRGLFAVLPLVITIALLYWLLTTIENILGSAIKWIWPNVYFPGFGLLVGLTIIFALGVLLQGWVIRGMWNWFEKLLKKVPLLKTLYGSVQDFLSVFGSQNKDFSQVVTITWGGRRVLGFITRDAFDDLPSGLAAEGDVCVYVPMGYQLGGFTFFVPRSDVEPVEGMSLERAMKFAITAGASTESHAPGKEELAEPETA